jgi:anti-sigma regulatory factor (Ser/Thr protein kinase)
VKYFAVAKCEMPARRREIFLTKSEIFAPLTYHASQKIKQRRKEKMLRYEVKTILDLQTAAQEFCRHLESQSVPKDKVYDCRLVVNELVGNILRHSDGVATFHGIVGGNRVEIFVRSTSVFIPPKTSECSPVTAEGGRGLFLVDKVSISRTVTPDGEIKVIIQY